MEKPCKGALVALLVALTALAPIPAAAAARKAPPPATAKKARLAVADLGSPPTMIGMSGKITKLVADAAAKEGTYEVIDPAAVRLGIGDEKVKELQACAGKAACIGAIAEPLGVQRLVTGLLDRTADSYIVKLWLVDVPGRSIVSSVDRKILIASRRLEKDVAEAIPALLKGEAEATGQAAITVAGAEGATLTVDGAPAGTAPLTWTGKPGKHTLKVERDGYYPVDRFFTVDAGATTAVDVALVPVPGAKPPPKVAGKDGKKPVEDEGGGLVLPLGSWIAGGVAVAALGGGVAFGAMASSTESDATVGEDGVRAITREEALGGQSDATTANVLFGVAGAALLTGVAIAIFFPADGGSGGDAPVAVGPASGGVAVSGSF